jgi:DNA-binding MarR family transcriptional regulator
VESARDLSQDQYRALAEFRRQLRRFLSFSEITAKEDGLEAQQHQMLLALRGLPAGVRPTVRELATRMFIRHHSAVELIDRLEKLKAVARDPGSEDRREVLVRLTPAGCGILRKLAMAHRAELERSGPELARSLQSVLRKGRKTTSL